MMHVSIPDHYHDLLNKLSSLPKKILLLYGHDYIAHFVMHELCNESLLNIDRAAYFIDNPDFDCLHGVAGFCKKEAYNDASDIWQNQQSFVDAVKGSSFNAKVQGFKQQSMKKQRGPDNAIVEKIADSLQIPNPAYYSWDMKHDNHGIFVFQKNDTPAKAFEYLSDSVCLLGFCPVF